MTATRKSHWDRLSYDIRTHIYSFIKTPEEQNRDYKIIMRDVFCDMWKAVWKRWIQTIQDPVKRTALECIFSEWPYKNIFRQYKWKTPDQVRFEIFVYPLKLAKTGVTVKMDGAKIFRAYVRTLEQSLQYTITDHRYGGLLEWYQQEKTDLRRYYHHDENGPQCVWRGVYCYVKCTGMYVKNRKYYHHWQDRLMQNYRGCRIL